MIDGWISRKGKTKFQFQGRNGPLFIVEKLIVQIIDEKSYSKGKVTVNGISWLYHSFLLFY